jgi:predicted transcriptional regulator
MDKLGSHVSHISPKVILTSPNLYAGADGQVSLINQLINSVWESKTEALFEIHGMRRETVTSAIQLAEALRIMKDLRVEELLVVDSLNNPYGVLEQAAVLSQLVLELTS